MREEFFRLHDREFAAIAGLQATGHRGTLP
jgi:hypothetical protein